MDGGQQQADGGFIPPDNTGPDDYEGIELRTIRRKIFKLKTRLNR